jgi:three-Cys-motif partner protein
VQDAHPDPCPDLIVERGVGAWVPQHKHRYLAAYLTATRYAWKKWPNRVLIDPFAGPGRIQVKDESFTRDGGAVVAWRALRSTAPFTSVLVGDIDSERAKACEQRLRSLGAPARSYSGDALVTVPQMIADLPKSALCLAYLDPYNLESLSFEILQALAALHVDLAINFSTMDLQRNVDLELDPERARFDGAAPRWRDAAAKNAVSKPNLPGEFFRYWCGLVTALGFKHSREMPRVTNNRGQPIYRMVFFTRNDLPKRIWDDVARGPNRSLDLFD